MRQQCLSLLFCPLVQDKRGKKEHMGKKEIIKYRASCKFKMMENILLFKAVFWLYYNNNNNEQKNKIKQNVNCK